MRESRRPAAFVFLGLLLVTGVGLASNPPKEGRTLPNQLRTLIWSKACDVVVKDWDVDCTKPQDPGLCAFKRADGEAFEPSHAGGSRSYDYARASAGWSMLVPAARESGAIIDEDDADAESPAFQFIAGVPLQVNNRDRVVRLTLEALTWIGRELLPEPAQPMCGQTAADLYAKAFQAVARPSALAWEHVKQSGQLKGLTVKRLAAEHDARKGRTWSLCVEFAEATAVKQGYDAPMLRDECTFWLRRGAVHQAEVVAGLLGTVLERFDPDFYREHAAAFATPTKKPGR